MGCMHSSGGMKQDGPGTDPGGIPVKANPEAHPGIIQLSQLTKLTSHAFTAKSFKKRRVCDVCGQNIDNPGAFCKECKIVVHKMCEAKVPTACIPVPDLHSSTKSVSQKKRGSLPRRKSVEQVMEHVMEGHYDFDLTYITERIISVFFVPDLEEHRYRQNLQEVASMLKSKHQDKFLLLNLSEKRHDITRLNPKVQDYAWPDLHAPPLDRICAICKAMETWLTSDPHNVVVLHCKGNKGKTGVIVAAYMHYSKISAGADQALTTLAMRKFCEDKVSSSLQPSQSRYIYYFSSLLSGSIKMNSSPLFLHQILVPSLPNFQTGGGFYPFLKIYQSLQLAYTSGVYDPQSSRARKLCVTMEPALLLKGDIMVKCYHRRSRAAEREVVFRVQFHTCTVHGAQLWFGKTELDLACTDDRFPPDATVEFIFANSPEKLKGREYRKNDSSVKVDYKTSDPVVKWDSYENLNLHHEDSMENIAHTRGPLDGSLYAQVRKRRGPGATSPNGCLTSSPTVKPQIQSAPRPQPFTFNCSPRGSAVSSDQLSETSLSITCSEREDPDCPLRKEDVEDKAKEKRKQRERDRETAILDDGDLSSSGVMRQEHSCCGQEATRCSDAGWERDRDLCLPNGRFVGHCNSIRKHPKSQTLPALPSKSMSPPPHSAIMELCHRHSAHPVAELTWDRPIHPPSLPCLNRPCYPYPNPEHALTHSHTLPASNRCYPGEECHLLHYPDHGSGSRPSLQPQPGSPYREVFVSSPKSSSYCHCQDCSSRREHPSTSVNVFQQLHSDQAENTHWPNEAGVQRPREAPLLWGTEKPWELTREAELWQSKSSQPAFHLYHSTLDQVSNLEQPRFAIAQDQNYPVPQSLMDVRDGASSGYHTPLQPRHSCPCAPYQSSPSESRESRGYASGYHSGSVSPMPASSPSPGRGRLPDIPLGSREQSHTEQHKEKAKTVAEDDIPQDSESKSDVRCQSSTPGRDSDHDYTVIDSISPTHTEDSANADSSIQSLEAGTHLESDTNTGKPVTPQSNEQTQNSTVSANPTNTSAEPFLKGDNELAVAEVKGSLDEKTKSNYATVIFPPVQVQLNGTALPVNLSSEASCLSNKSLNTNPSNNLSSSLSSPTSYAPIGSPDKQSSPQRFSSANDKAGHRLIPDQDISADTKPPSPVPDGYHTPTFPLASYYYSLLNVPRVPYTGYTAVTIPAIQPPLPEKKRFSPTAVSPNGHIALLHTSSCPSPVHHVTFSPAVGEQRRESAQHSYLEEAETRVNSKFVQDSSKYWYKPGISRDQAIAVLKDKDPGAFLIRDSNSFQGAYGLALKVATPPPNANITGNKGDPVEQLVRHFLIETGPRGVKIKGCQNESYFGSLSALVYQHSITPISLPCALHIPDKDLVGELQEMQSATNTSTAADLLKQGAACNVFYLNSVETESLTGPEAVSKAIKCTKALNPRPVPTVVHFKVSSQGITLTDSKRRVFFRRHYPISSVTFSSLDPQNQRWTNSDSTSSKMFGFVARRTGTTTENVCHLFAEMDPEQPAVAIVNFINKVMLGPQLRR
ncbi:tensin-2-like isoform X2 [Poeciliopsis prolifica]|uniref:tensin-2-like isoform X2 n=1 Tax=Poeciliopsis prolifica TaxID=188132 RepID=UPI002413150F|nr:tensin-2-like isoform X2 [Poeciliopsis prolifica]